MTTRLPYDRRGDSFRLNVLPHAKSVFPTCVGVIPQASKVFCVSYVFPASVGVICTVKILAVFLLLAEIAFQLPQKT
jgi:hypothetical protein